MPVSAENLIRSGIDAAMSYPRAGMLDLLKLLGGFLVGLFRSRSVREAEVAFLRHQLLVLKRSAPARPKLHMADRLIFVWLYRLFPSLLEAAVIFQPQTLVRWHRSGFRLYWLCLPIMPSEVTVDGDRQARQLMQFHRLSAPLDGAECPCAAQDACALRYNRRNSLPTDGEGDFRRTLQHGRDTRVGSIRSAVQHDRSATARMT